jgi:hypothetical protein
MPIRHHHEPRETFANRKAGRARRDQRRAIIALKRMGLES